MRKEVSNPHPIANQKSKIENFFRGMVSMVSMEVSKTLGPGSSPGTPAIIEFKEIK